MTGLVLIVVLLGLMWAVVVLPQQRRVKAHQRLCDRIEVGHVVMTTAGLFGTVVEAGADRLVLEIAPGVRVVAERRSVGMLVPDGTSLADLADVSRPTPEPVPPTGSSMGERLGLGAPASGSTGTAPDAEATAAAGGADDDPSAADDTAPTATAPSRVEADS
ncbi:MAG: preprotein translocase subunit YajC [Acidimicrobiales bacterium]